MYLCVLVLLIFYRQLLAYFINKHDIFIFDHHDSFLKRINNLFDLSVGNTLLLHLTYLFFIMLNLLPFDVLKKREQIANPEKTKDQEDEIDEQL